MNLMNSIKEYPCWSVAIAVIGSELIWRFIKYMRKKPKPLIHEVIIFNELGEACGGQICKLMQETPDICPNRYCSNNNVNRFIHYIDQATYSIDVAIYTFTSTLMINALKRALQRHVSVRVISDQEMVYSSGSQILGLVALGVPVRGPDSMSMMHHKFCVIDGTARVEQIKTEKKRQFTCRPFNSVVLSGSVNWTKQGFSGNWENCIITSDSVITEKFQFEFDRMWKSFKPATSQTKLVAT